MAAIKYCDVCNKRITGENFDAGTAVEWNNRTYCDAHVPEEARAAVGARGRSGAFAGSPSNRRTTKISSRARNTPNGASTGTKTPPPSSGRRAGSTTKRRTSDEFDPTDGMPTPKSQMPLILGAVVVACVVLGGVLVFANITGKSSNSSEMNDAPEVNTNNRANLNLPGSNGKSAAEMQREARERERKDLEAQIDRMVTAFGDFESEIKGMSESALNQKANQLYDEAAQLAEKVERMRGTVDINKDKKFELEQLVEDTGRHAAKLYLDKLNQLKSDGISRLDFANTTKKLEDAHAGRNLELLPAKFHRSKYALDQITSMIDDVRRESDSFRECTPQELDGLRELMPVRQKALDFEAQTGRDETMFNSARTLMQDAFAVVNRHPAIYGQARPNSMARKQSQSTFDALLKVMHQHLTAEYSRLDRRDAAAVERWVGKAQYVTGIINGGPIFEDLKRKTDELRGTANNNNNNNANPGQIPTGPIPQSVSSMVARAEAAGKDTSLDVQICVLARLILFGRFYAMTGEGGSKLTRAMRDLDDAIFRRLKADHGNLRGADPNSWRARAFIYSELTSAIETLRAHGEEIDKLDDDFGQYTVEFISATNDFIATFIGGRQVNDDMLTAMWEPIYTFVQAGTTVVERTNDDQLARLVNASVTNLINSVASRAQSIGSRQQARLISTHAGKLVEVLPAEMQIAGQLKGLKAEVDRETANIPEANATN